MNTQILNKFMSQNIFLNLKKNTGYIDKISSIAEKEK